MSLVRLIARPMLASGYIANGISRAKSPASTAHAIAPVLRAAQGTLPVQISATTAARGAGIAQAAAGAMLAIGKFPRLSSIILINTYLLDAVGAREADDTLEAPHAEPRTDRTGTRRRASLLMKTSMLGGALLAAVDTNGKPGLMWRAQHAADSIRKEVEKNSSKALDKISPKR